MTSYRQLRSRSRSGYTRPGRVRSPVTQTAPRGIGPTPAQLQRRLGNRVTQAWLAEQAPVQQIQMKDQPDEINGRKDVEGEELLQGKFDSMQRQGPEEEELLQGKFAANEAPTQLQGGEGQAENSTGMPGPLKAGLEQLSGMDLSGVRVHNNSSKPVQLNALAYTQGQDIHVGPGQEKHLPHEGWHAVQQMQGRVQPTMQAKGVSINDDAGLEREVDEMGAKAAAQMKTPDSAAIEAVPEELEVATLVGPAQMEEGSNKPVFAAYKGKSINKIGHVSAPADQYKVAKSSGVNVRAKPDGTLPHIAKVVYDTEVQVQALDNTSAFYFIIAKTGAVGWVNKNFVVLQPPDIGSRLHHITESNLTTILKNEYVDKKLWTLATGNDYTTLAAAVVVANEGRKGVSVDWEKAKKYKDDNTLKSLFDPWMIDNFAIYHGSKVLAGHNIWLPSPDYVRMLQKSGVIGSRPGWINAAVDVGKGIAGFLAGIVSGIFGSLWDTLTGLWELGKGIVNTVRSVLDGSIFASVEALYDTITGMTWESLKDMVNEIITMGKSAFNDFQNKWDHPNSYKKWHFRGYVIGAIALEVILAIFTGGATLAAKVLAKIGKYLPKLMRIFNKLLALAKKLPGRRRKSRADKPGKGKDRDRDRDKDERDMSKDDRAWEQARAMAALVTEGHDTKDTPVSTLIPMLNSTIAVRFGGVNRYKAIPKGPPNTYKIIQLARKNDVDDHYTERKTEEADKNKGLRKIYNSLREAPEYPKDFQSVKNGVRKLNIKNKQLLHKLREIEPGEWKKIYKDGYSNGKKISIHYFQSRSGKVFNVSVKRGWSNLE